MKNFYLVIEKERIYSYGVSIITIVILLFMSVYLKMNLDSTEVTSTNLDNTQNEIVSNDNYYNMYK